MLHVDVTGCQCRSVGEGDTSLADNRIDCVLTSRS